jgi:hypothetical protein
LTRKFTHKSYKEISHYWKLMAMNEKTFMAASIVIIILVPSLAVGYYWTTTNNQNPELTPTSSPNPIPSQSNFYLGNSRIFVISANASYGSYPSPTVTSPPYGSIIAQNGERCIIINVALRNDYSIEFPPPNILAPESWNVSSVYVFLTAHLYNGNNQIEATDITNPNALGYWANNAYTQLDFGESTTVSIYLATSSDNVTSFQLHTNYIGELPPP